MSTNTNRVAVSTTESVWDRWVDLVAVIYPRWATRMDQKVGAWLDRRPEDVDLSSDRLSS